MAKLIEKSVYETLPDPTRVFSALVLGILWLRFLITTKDASQLFWGFFASPYVVGFFSLACFTVYLGYNPKSKLSAHDRWAAEWYFWNAWLYHMTMDGASGTFRLIPVVVQQYDILDRRFVQGHPIVWAVGFFELFIMAPLSLASCYAILQNRPQRYPLEIITSSFHFMGMVLFVLTEVLLDEQVNVPARDPVGVPGNAWANVKFLDFDHLVYYWFGFWFCNLIWGVVPLLRIRCAWNETVAALESQKKQ